MSKIIVNGDGDSVIVATGKNPAVICAGIQGIQGVNGTSGSGGGGNFTGLTGFTNGNGFTGNVTNNNLSLTLQNANATQPGQLTAAKFVEFDGKGTGTSNLTIGNTSTTAFRGDYGLNLSDSLAAHTGNVTNPHGVTKAQIGLSNVSDVTSLELPISNATQTELNGKQGTLISGTNIKTINGASILGSGDMIIAGGGNISGIIGFTDGAGFTGNVSSNYLSLSLQYANSTQDGQITSGKYTEWDSKGTGTSNLTLGTTGTTALKGNATTADVSASTNKNYVTDAQLAVINATSGANTGDQDLSALALKATTVNGVNLSSNITLTTANISASSNKNYVTDANLAVINVTSGTNTGDNSVNTRYSGLVSNANHTGDVTGDTALTLATVNSNVGTFGNATIVPAITVNAKGLVTGVTNVTISSGSGTVTRVGGTGTVNGLSLGGNVTGDGNLTLTGTLSGTASGLTVGNAQNVINLSGVITGSPSGGTWLTENAINSSELRGWLTDETGTGSAVFASSPNISTPIITTPNLTTPSYVNLTSAISLPLTTGVTGVLPVANGGVDQSAWTSYTPTVTGITVGNGTLSCAYKKLTEKTVVFRFQLTCGSTSSASASLPTITLPLTAASGQLASLPIGNLSYYDVSAPVKYSGIVLLESTTTAGLYVEYTGGTYSFVGGIITNVPVTMASGDVITAECAYEIA